MDRDAWERTARDLSALFRDWPDIQSSQVRVFLCRGEAYFTSSEGAEIVQPLTHAAVQIHATAQATDGEPLADHVLFYGTVPSDLPALETMKQDLKGMAEELVALGGLPLAALRHMTDVASAETVYNTLVPARPDTGVRMAPARVARQHGAVH